MGNANKQRNDTEKQRRISLYQCPALLPLLNEFDIQKSVKHLA